jgi:hypothetical protein
MGMAGPAGFTRTTGAAPLSGSPFPEGEGERGDARGHARTRGSKRRHRTDWTDRTDGTDGTGPVRVGTALLSCSAALREIRSCLPSSLFSAPSVALCALCVRSPLLRALRNGGQSPISVGGRANADGGRWLSLAPKFALRPERRFHSGGKAATCRRSPKADARDGPPRGSRRGVFHHGGTGSTEKKGPIINETPRKTEGHREESFLRRGFHY